ncbi:unnamed protein product [Effrenium voratum]|uniref:Uncharacterized protein n=1 Tax=Effrenium voratum TaxID=2562239 RepID=A0AA36IFA6_9DINO|nr:unnamed protein product [Effrenium voratum]
MLALLGEMSAAAAWTWRRIPRPRPARPEIPPRWSGLPTASAPACFCSPSQNLLCRERRLRVLRLAPNGVTYTAALEACGRAPAVLALLGEMRASRCGLDVAPACPAAGAQRGHLHRRPGGLRPRAGGAGTAG